MLYRLHTLDVTPDNEINDEWSTSDLVWLPDHNPTVDDLRRELVNLERMAEDWPADDLKMEEDGDDILVCHKDGRKGYKLVPEKDEKEEETPKCPKCGQEMTDTFCHTGRPRCDDCDPECLGCYSGPGPMG